MGFPGASACNAGDSGLIPGWEDPLEKGMTTTPVFLPGEAHGQRSLMDYSPSIYKPHFRAFFFFSVQFCGFL